MIYIPAFLYLIFVLLLMLDLIRQYKNDKSDEKNYLRKESEFEPDDVNELALTWKFTKHAAPPSGVPKGHS